MGRGISRFGMHREFHHQALPRKIYHCKMLGHCFVTLSLWPGLACIFTLLHSTQRLYQLSCVASHLHNPQHILTTSSALKTMTPLAPSHHRPSYTHSTTASAIASILNIVADVAPKLILILSRPTQVEQQQGRQSRNFAPDAVPRVQLLEPNKPRIMPVLHQKRLNETRQRRAF